MCAIGAPATQCAPPLKLSDDLGQAPRHFYSCLYCDGTLKLRPVVLSDSAPVLLISISDVHHGNGNFLIFGHCWRRHGRPIPRFFPVTRPWRPAAFIMQLLRVSTRADAAIQVGLLVQILCDLGQEAKEQLLALPERGVHLRKTVTSMSPHGNAARLTMHEEQYRKAPATIFSLQQFIFPL